MTHAIYLDNMATTPVDPGVLDAMLPYLSEVFGNAASNHRFGHKARTAVERARRQVAAAIGCEADEIVFTSGATESDNLAVKGVVECRGVHDSHIITVATEHKAILDTCKHLAAQGCRVDVLPVDSQGLVSPEALREAITESTVLVSIMLANNEIGVIQPVEDLANAARERGVLFHTDAAQAVGKIPVDVRTLGVDLLSLTAHKIYGPKGIGALYVRRGTALAAQMHGGGHEGNMRSGTLNVAGIVGLGEAAAIAARGLEVEGLLLTQLRNRLLDALTSRLPAVTLNGHPESRVPGNLNLQFEGVDGEAVMASMSEIAVSSGAACNAASVVPSYVLKALGLTDRQARSSLRIGLGRFNTREEVDRAADRIVETVNWLRSLSPLFDAA